jgi:hypothetical protein
MDESWMAIGLLFVGLLLVAAGLFYYMSLTLSGTPPDSRVTWGLIVAGVALFFAGGTIWRRGRPPQ